MGEERVKDLLVDWSRAQGAVHEEDDVDASFGGDTLHVLDHLLSVVVGDVLGGGKWVSKGRSKMTECTQKPTLRVWRFAMALRSSWMAWTSPTTRIVFDSWATLGILSQMRREDEGEEGASEEGGDVDAFRERQEGD